jgi:hypothetical protein
MGCTAVHIEATERCAATSGLDDLIAFDADDRAVGPADRLRRSLSCRLASVLLRDLRCECSEDRHVIFELTTARHDGILTFADLFHHPSPPLDLLAAAKDYAKLCFYARHSPLLPEVALLVYYASIASALVRLAARISTLTDEELRTGWNEALRQPWLDPRTRQLFTDALATLRAGRAWRA